MVQMVRCRPAIFRELLQAPSQLGVQTLNLKRVKQMTVVIRGQYISNPNTALLFPAISSQIGSNICMFWRFNAVATIECGQSSPNGVNFNTPVYIYFKVKATFVGRYITYIVHAQRFSFMAFQWLQPQSVLRPETKKHCVSSNLPQFVRCLFLQVSRHSEYPSANMFR